MKTDTYIDTETRLTTIIANSHRLVFLGGAGVSTESGIPDFRSSEGLYTNKSDVPYAPEEILSHDFFMEHPAEFYTFYRSHMLFPNAQPGTAHRALAQLEQEGKLAAVITQNIDGLHQKAGSEHVLELHGSVLRNHCLGCGKEFDLPYILASKGVPHCDVCGKMIKPDVVLYGEPLDEAVLSEAFKYIRTADTLIVGGTSLVVMPAAGLIRYFRGNELVLINLQATPYDALATLVLNKNINTVLKPFA
jgi:NAD-dependent protein deacetylases, SIR2 family